MKQSEKLGLNLPEDDDFFDVEHQNENMRKIDEYVCDQAEIKEHLQDERSHITPEERESWNEAKTKADALEGTTLTGTLGAGETCITLTDDSINEDSTIDIYTSVYGVSPKAIEVANGNITMTFKAQSEDIGVKVVVK